MRGVSHHIVNQTNNASRAAASAECTFFSSTLNDTLLTNFPIACSDSPYFEEAAQWLYYSHAGRRGTHKADGRDNSSPSLSGPRSGGWNKRCDGEGQEAIVLRCSSMDFSRRHPVAPDLNTEGRPQTVMGDGEPETHAGPAVPLCLCLAVLISSDQFVLLTSISSGWVGGIALFF